MNGGSAPVTVVQRISKSISKYAWTSRWRMPMAFDQGIWGCDVLNSSDILLAA
jgi:hypothetical protein